MRLHQRHHIDIGWGDLLFATTGLLRPEGDAARNDIIRHWPPHLAVVPCLSVRTAFDALLTVLDLEPGDEIIMSGVNIAGMAEIAAAHQLTIRAADIDPETLSPSPEATARLVTDRTRLILIAHLFGGHVDLAPFAGLRSGRILLVEDCAQAWTPEFRGSQDADVSLFSFGPIKTITALGGGIAVLRDNELARRLEAHLAGYPRKGRRWFLARIAKFAALKAVSHPLPYGVIHRVMGLMGLDFEAKMGALARGFGQGDLLARIRQRPPAALLRLLARRLSRPSNVPARRDAGDHVIAAARQGTRIGQGLLNPSHWVTPILVDDPRAVRQAMLASGLDATLGTTSIRALGEEAGETPLAAEMLRRILYLPSPLALPEPKREELRRLVAALPPQIAGGPARQKGRGTG